MRVLHRVERGLWQRVLPGVFVTHGGTPHRRRAGQGCARLRRRLCCPVRQPCPAALRYPRCAGGGARGSWCSRRCVTPNVAPVSLWFAELTCRRSVRYSAAGWPSRRSREPSSTPAWACGRRARCGRLWLRSSNAVVAPPLSSESSWLARLPATAHSAGPPSARWEPVPGRLRSARWASCSAPRNCPHSSRTSMCTTQPGLAGVRRCGVEAAPGHPRGGQSCAPRGSPGVGTNPAAA